jgi:hypothetical protein
VLSVALAACGGGGAKPLYPRDGVLRLNQIQVRGTHNSYHPPLPALDAQLDHGARQLELDVFAEPSVGFAVHHTLTDLASSCPELVACLGVIRRWMDGHRNAGPLFVVIEDKDAGAAALDALDAAVRSGLPGRRLLTPDEVLVRGGRRWPTLGRSRGRAVVVLIGDPAEPYSRGGTSLRGRAMFVYSNAGPIAAVTSRPDPIGQAAEIATFVRAGLIVRTQADDGLLDVRRRPAALSSGAQILSARDESFVLPDGTPSRCDPLLVAPGACSPSDVERSRSPGNEGAIRARLSAFGMGRSISSTGGHGG